MLRYLVILLDDTSVSYCHCDNTFTERRPMPLEMLKAALLFAMKENLMVQAVYPDYELPEEYERAIRKVDHAKIKPAGHSADADIVIINNVSEVEPGVSYVLRCTKAEFFENAENIGEAVAKALRLNVVIKDIETLKADEHETYSKALKFIAERIRQARSKGKNPQTNLLTDGLQLKQMNNCNAGTENITLAPDGRFYVCPVFYYERLYDVGSLAEGLDIKNKHLYNLEYAPICRTCKAFHCKRCIWLNLKTTLEVNTPSYEQCEAAALEQEISIKLK